MHDAHEPHPDSGTGSSTALPLAGRPRERLAACVGLAAAVVGMHFLLIGSVSATLHAPVPPAADAASPPAVHVFAARMAPRAEQSMPPVAPAAQAGDRDAERAPQTSPPAQLPVAQREPEGPREAEQTPMAEPAAAETVQVAVNGTAGADLADIQLAGVELAGVNLAGAGTTPTGAGADQPSALPATPVYAVRVPAAMGLRYRLSRGLLRGEGSLEWRPAGDRYEAVLEGRVLGVEVLSQRSTGGFDAAGLAPLRFTDRRRGRDTQAANFQRDKGLVSFSGPSTVLSLPPGAQDRVSWLIQLAAIANARAGGLKPGDRLQLPVIGARGDADVWSFTVVGSEAVELEGAGLPARTDAWRLRREPDRPHDTRAEAWLDPTREHMPVRVRIGADSGDALELLLTGQSQP